jgi:hypothetical protein
MKVKFMSKKDNDNVRVAARQQATELTVDEMSSVSGAGTHLGTGKCTVGVIAKCEDWETD